MSSDDEYAAYRDADGHPRLTTSCLLFFDVLGTSAMSLAPNAVEYLRSLRPALEDAVQRAGTDDRVFGQASTWFTDNAIVAIPFCDAEISEAITGGLQVAAAYLLLVCWGRGFLGRGAITLGPHYMDERFVFGPALIEAVGLEKAAKWPRIILGPDVIALEREHSRSYNNPLTSAQSSCLSLDEDGVVFVDHLGIYIDEEDNDDALDHFLHLHRRATEDALAAHPQGSDPWEKWRWLAEYQNHALVSRHREPAPYMIELPERRHEFRDFLDDLPYAPPASPWYVLDRQPRTDARGYSLDFLPDSPGVYGFYRDGARVYVGGTNNLFRRLRNEHLSRNASMRNSALRRNVAEELGISLASEIRTGHVGASSADVERVAGWLDECEIGWQECSTENEAKALAAELKRQHLPPLNST